MEQKKIEKYMIYFIGLVAAFVVFVAIKQTSSTDLLPLIFSVLGAVFTSIRFSRRTHKNPFKQLFNLLKDDYALDNYAFLSLASIVYAISQGACLGAALGFLIDCLHALVNQQSNSGYYLSSFVFSLAFLLIIRVLLELYSVIFRAAQDLRRYVRRNQTTD